MISETGEAIEKGQMWYVKYPLENELVKVQVTDVTAMTIAVDPQIISFGFGGSIRRPARYQHDYLKFIERIGSDGANTT